MPDLLNSESLKQWRHGWRAWVLGAVSLCFMGLILSLLVVWAVFSYYSKDLPGFEKLVNYQPATVTRLYADDGRLLAEYAVEKRVFVPLSSIPKPLIHAFLSAEDKNFYSHGGIDFMGLGRAIFTNLSNYGGGHSPVGGSTITQQVIKNFLLTNEKTFERKIKEAILSFRVSKTLSKDKILELYLNQIYLGSGSYGVAAAALNYFNKSIDDLTLEEAAFLAALPKAPSAYNPRQFYERAKGRRDWVISRMESDGYVSPNEAMIAQAKPISLQRRQRDELIQADFFAEEVRRELAQRFGSDTLYEGGLFVQTTLNSAMQEAADNSLRHALEAYDRRHGYRGPVAHLNDTKDWKTVLTNLPQQKYARLPEHQLAMVLSIEKTSANIGFTDGSAATLPADEVKWTGKPLAKAVSVGDVILVEKIGAHSTADDNKKPTKDPMKDRYKLVQQPAVNGAMVVIENATGRVRALSGGYIYGDTEFNRATQALRQPGSAIKPFVYLAALENGFRPNSIIMDSPIELSQGAGLGMWRPQNYTDDFLGASTMRTGLEQSRNAMTVRLGTSIGIDNATEIMQRFGIYDKPQRMFSTVLGAQETTLLKLTSAYAMLANGGKKIVPSLIERIDDRHGKTVLRHDERECKDCQVAEGVSIDKIQPPELEDVRPILSEATSSYQLVHMLEGVVQRGTAKRASKLGKPLGGKTGTTNDSRDTWFIGFSPDITVGVFVGYDKPRSLGKKETGGAVALPAFIEFFETAQKDVPAKDFVVPEGIVMRPIARVSGQVLPADAYQVDGNAVIMEAFKVIENKQPPSEEIIQDNTLPWLREEKEQAAPLSNDYPSARPSRIPFGSPSRPLTQDEVNPSEFVTPRTGATSPPAAYSPKNAAPAPLEFAPPPAAPQSGNDE